MPVVNVALAPWAACVAKNRRDMVERRRNACKDREVARVNRTDLPFGFDASVLLPRRWRPTFEEQGLGTPQEADKWGKDYVRPLLAEMSEPYAYVACLVADGDGMGAAIETMQSALDHRTFSRALAGFAGKARANQAVCFL